MTRPTTALTAALALAALAAPQPALAVRGTLTVRGAGFGHGVGMSQYGAYGYALHGWSAADILAHYYSGTALGTTDPNQTIRVLLQTPSVARFSGASQAGARTLDPAATYAVRARGAGEVDLLSVAGRRLATFTAPLQVAGAGGVTALQGAGSYRGILEVSPSGSGVTVVNAVGLDDYVQGVVPAESPASWPLEALKAQAIAARTYAITTGHGGAFDQYADTRSQVYRGVGAETPASNDAVSETRGQVVTYGGRPVVTYFFSTSGGRTEDVENAWAGAAPAPWLRSVADPYDGVSPHHRWSPYTLSLARAQSALGGLVRGSFRGILVSRRGASPRILAADVVGSGGRVRVSGATLSARLRLLDTWAYFTSITSRAARAPATRPLPRPNPQAMPGDGGAVGGTARRSVPAGALAGTVLGPRAGSALRLQVRVGARWVDVAKTRLARSGSFLLTAAIPGTYRVACAGAYGPSVRVG